MKGAHYLSAFVSLFIALLTIVHLVRNDGYISVEWNDEAVHTLIEIPMAHTALASGELMEINLFNNFGTPLSGDPVALPWALHSLTYIFVSGHAGMLLNRAILTFLTLIVVYLYLCRHLRPATAWLGAFISFTSPGYVHFFHHHPHQIIMLAYTLVIFMFERMVDRDTRWNRLLFLFSVIVFYSSVGTNGAVVSTPFFFVHGFVTARHRLGKVLVPTLALGAAAFLLTAPGYAALAQWASLSARAGFNITQWFEYSLWEWLARICWFAGYRQYHTDIVLNFTPFVLCASCVGIYFTLQQRQKEIRLLAPLYAIAFCVIILCALLVFFKNIYSAIPGFRATDITRFTWVQNIYLGAAAAYGLQHALKCRKARIVLLISCLLYFLPPILSLTNPKFVLHIYATAIGTAALFTSLYFTGRALQVIFIFAVVGIILAPRLMTVYYIHNDAYRVPEWKLNFWYPKLGYLMEPGKRLSTFESPIPNGNDLRAAKIGVLGAGGRSIIMHAETRDRFNKFLAPHQDWTKALDYALPIVPPALYSYYGIEYLMAPEQFVEVTRQMGWRGPLGFENGFALFENPVGGELAYGFDDGQLIMMPTTLGVDTVEVTVPAGYEGTLIATFISWPGWSVKIDGVKTSMLNVTDNRPPFIAVMVPAGSSQVEFTFSAVPAWVRIVSVFGSLLFGGAGILTGRVDKHFSR